ncbi:hypothetical protein BM74_16140 [Bacillus thuringiensis]|uniref:Uncharacterized protein n=1 Tax=Bacillus thuringiensis TaxID=1428 RepID=A0A437SII0_BACTU|nr:hypothetical protein BM74_16140 [Bacillus thuringiensis]
MPIFKEIKYFKSFLVYMKKIHFISILKLMGMWRYPLNTTLFLFVDRSNDIKSHFYSLESQKKHQILKGNEHMEKVILLHM